MPLKLLVSVSTHTLDLSSMNFIYTFPEAIDILECTTSWGGNDIAFYASLANDNEETSVKAYFGSCSLLLLTAGDTFLPPID